MKWCAEAFPFKLGLRSICSHKVLENTQILFCFYLNKQSQVDVIGLRAGPADLAVFLVADVDTLK